MSVPSSPMGHTPFSSRPSHRSHTVVAPIFISYSQEGHRVLSSIL